MSETGNFLVNALPTLRIVLVVAEVLSRCSLVLSVVNIFAKIVHLISVPTSAN